MKRKVLILISLIISSISNAETKGFFGNPDKVVIVIQGKQGDKDAPRLFAALSVQPEESGSTYLKKITYTSIANEKILDISCNVSKSIPDFGSCTMVLYKSSRTAIGSASVYLAFGKDQDSERISQLFNGPIINEQIYVSEDGKLSIRLYEDLSPQKLFSIVYR